MANICDTEFRITGTKKAIDKLFNAFKELSKNNQEIRLCNLAEYFNIDVEKKHIDVRGVINYFTGYNFGDIKLIEIKTETAWTTCSDLFDAINETLNNELEINYREIEIGSGIFHIHGNSSLFTEECVADWNGNIFKDCYGGRKFFDTFDDAINFWCGKINYDRENKTIEEMLKIISLYEYNDEDEDTFFYINGFEIY